MVLWNSWTNRWCHWHLSSYTINCVHALENESENWITTHDIPPILVLIAETEIPVTQTSLTIPVKSQLNLDLHMQKPRKNVVIGSASAKTLKFSENFASLSRLLLRLLPVVAKVTCFITTLCLCV